MAIEKMTHVTLSGPLAQFDRGALLFVLDRAFHPEAVDQRFSAIESLRPFSLKNPYSPLIETLRDIAKSLDIPLSPKAFDVNLVNLQRAERYIEELGRAVDRLLDRRRQLERIVADKGQIMETLRHIHGIDENLEGLFHMKSLIVRFGRIPRPIYHEAQGRIHARRDSFFLPTNLEAGYLYGLYFAPQAAREQVDAFFLAFHFQRILLPQELRGRGEEAIAYQEAERRGAKAEIAQLDIRLEALRDLSEGKVRTYASYLDTLSRAYALRQYAGHTETTFYLVGWVPRNIADAYAAEVERQPGFRCVLSDAAALPHLDPPIQFRQSFLARSFRPLVEMYGLPAYREIDPSFFLAIIYILLFGVMFGDVGQGFLLILTGALLKRLKNMWIGTILMLAGASAVVFGFVYGSVFGYEQLLPGFRVLEGQGPIRILVLSAGAGVVLIIASMALNIVNGIKQRNPGKSLFSPNGLAGLVFYIASLAGLAGHFLFDRSLFCSFYIIAFILIPLILMLLHEPLSHLLRGEVPKLPSRPLGFFTEGLFHLFEVVLSFVSNTISFLRVGAFAIIHAGLMLVVFLLAQSAENATIAVLILGNLFVTALEALLVSIQLMRIGFYELFSRFFESGGRQFRPAGSE